MTNRKWILEQNEYDLLMRFNKYMDLFGPHCALKLVATEDWWEKHGRPGCDLECKECIQRWLNEERR